MAEQKHEYSSAFLNSLMAVLPFLAWLPRVNAQSLRSDIFAGITGAVIVLPQGVAFAFIAGLPPQYGLYTAMVTPVIAALFGSSRHLISGPTTAISIVVFSTISGHAQPGTPEFVSLALTLTLLAGVYQLAFGLARLGILVNFVSHTVIIGFTAGAAILIATSQMKNILGIDIPKGESFLHTWVNIWNEMGAANPVVLAIAAVTLLTALLIKRFAKNLPNLLIALIVGSGFAWILNDGNVGINLVGEIPGNLPPFSIPDLSLATIREIAPDAFAIALLGLIEAVSISRAIASKSHQRIDGNQEFVGQGLSNIVGSFFSCYAGSGSFTRSGINYDAGAVTPLSAIFSAIFLALIVLLVSPLTAYLPIAAMGGVIIMVAYNLIDRNQIKHVVESDGSEAIILVATFLATLFLELEFAIYLGVILSLVIFLGRTSAPVIAILAPDIDTRYNRAMLTDVESKPLDECPHMKIIRIDMSVYFGSLNFIQSKLFKISEKEGRKHIVVMSDGINFIDLAGAEMLCDEAERLEEEGGGLYFAGLKPAVYESFSETHAIKHIGNNHFFDDKPMVFKTLHRLLRIQGKCEGCKLKVFAECKVD
ncbi:MAG: SulP family inorganic anion transporter [Hyphomicrobiales bacterium]|nr:SulP family inorganic anion transporter [Hyphomicrobiales bacterium]